MFSSLRSSTSQHSFLLYFARSLKFNPHFQDRSIYRYFSSGLYLFLKLKNLSPSTQILIMKNLVEFHMHNFYIISKFTRLINSVLFTGWNKTRRKYLHVRCSVFCVDKNCPAMLL